MPRACSTSCPPPRTAGPSQHGSGSTVTRRVASGQTASWCVYASRRELRSCISRHCCGCEATFREFGATSSFGCLDPLCAGAWPGPKPLSNRFHATTITGTLSRDWPEFMQLLIEPGGCRQQFLLEYRLRCAGQMLGAGGTSRIRTRLGEPPRGRCETDRPDRWRWRHPLPSG
jgi:hypothetical protein